MFDDNVACTYGSNQIEVIEAGNQVIIKAIVERFEETNLYVKVGSEFFVFIVRYNSSPRQLLHNYQKAAVQSGGGTKSTTVIDVKTHNELKRDSIVKDSIANAHLENCRKIKSMPQDIFDRAETRYDMMFLVTNMYVKDNHIYIRLGIQNESDIDYNVQFVRFEVRNANKKVKAISEQKVELLPVYVESDPEVVKAKSFETPIYVLEEFTIDKNRKLHIEIWEKDGDRILQFSLSYRDILKIKQL